MSDDKGSKPEGKKKGKQDETKANAFIKWVKAKRTEFTIEFKKIQWPSRAELIKETLTVIIICIIFGAYIAILDSGFGFGFSAFASLVSR
ncbi:MAG: preprotein translocase subunit SecE [Clostridiales bacterium]|jgi:preprotein translocase subunit SecE|nr:preprotein translocase subunit SecE [Clostridiales bacterium]MDR2752520.1 preprotein translocase subunit SecE [Clostridiales bacterium]